MVVKSTKQDSTINKIFFTPSDWRLLELCPVPLLFTKNTSEYSYQRVMATVDLAKNNDKTKALDIKIIQMSLAIAELYEGEAHICHCYQPIGIKLWQSMISAGINSSLINDNFHDYSNSIKDQHQELFDELLSEYAFDEKLTHLEAGSVESELPELVKANQIDLLVMGMKNNGKFIGNTIEKVLDNVECDILSIRDAN
jgi:universal stress protein E